MPEIMVKSIDQLVVGGRYRCFNNSHDTDPFDGAPFKVLSPPFWARLERDGTELCVVVEAEGYDGPSGGLCWSGQGLAIGRINADREVTTRAQAYMIARLGINTGTSCTRNNSCYRILDEEVEPANPMPTTLI